MEQAHENKPTKTNFSELVLLRMYYKDNVQIHRDSIKISDFNTTIFHDASYVGGPVRYRVDLKGYKFYIQGEETSFDVTPLRVKLDSISTPPRIYWNKSSLYNNDIRIIAFNQSFPVNQPGTVDTYARIGQPDYTTVLVAANNPPPSQVFSAFQLEIRKEIYVGIKIPAFSEAAYVASLHAYFLVSQNLLYKIDDQTYQVSGVLNFSTSKRFVVSRNGTYAYLYSGSELQRVDLNSMSITDQINISDITQVYYQGVSSPTVSDDNMLSYSMDAFKQYVIDLTNKTIVWSKDARWYNSATISPDGQYLYWNQTVYKKNGGNWDTAIGTITLPPDYLVNAAFRSDTKNQLIVSTTASGIDLYDVASTSISGPTRVSTNSFSFRYDTSTETIMYTTYINGYLGDGVVVNANTNAEVRTLSAIYNPQSMVYLNGHFFHTTGAIIP
jgi:hypothetical protein